MPTRLINADGGELLDLATEGESLWWDVRPYNEIIIQGLNDAGEVGAWDTAVVAIRRAMRPTTGAGIDLAPAAELTGPGMVGPIDVRCIPYVGVVVTTEGSGEGGRFFIAGEPEGP